MNKTIFQFFHWYYPLELNLWNHVAAEATKLASLGVTDVWLPPAYKSSHGSEEPGYAVYDLYDLGEFEQKGSIRTKYGLKEEYLNCIAALQQNKISVLADIVLNHKMGGDEQQEIIISKVNEHNRLEFASESETVQAFTKFTFPGRKDRYSSFKWDCHSFTGLCEDGTIAFIHNDHTQEGWDKNLDDSKGNYDYLMGYDVEFRNPAVREELIRWGIWYVETTGIDGFRIDGLKHIPHDFFPEWIENISRHFNKSFFNIGEFWKGEIDLLLKYIELTEGKIRLFDVPFHYNLQEASNQRDQYDLRKIFDNSLVKIHPELAVTFVDNHDTQPLQALESTVEPWFQPLAYALILLRGQGIPCVFYPAIYSANYMEEYENGEKKHIELSRIEIVEKMMKVRAALIYGLQNDYFEDAHVLGWSLAGVPEKANSGCFVLMSNAGAGEKIMSMGKENAGREMVSISNVNGSRVKLDHEGGGLFSVKAGAVDVWIDVNAIDILN